MSLTRVIPPLISRHRGGPLMLRLLQKFWGARNRSNDTARSPSSRRSCRLQVEALEDRLTPSLSLSFFPIAHVSVNPQPLPPGSGNEVMFPGVYLEEVPLVGTPVPGVTTEHETLTGVLSKQVLLQTDPSASPSLWSLELFYSEKVSATENFVPPSAFNAGSFAATFSMTGSVAAVLTSANPLQPTFRMTLKLVETGGVSWTQPGTPPTRTAHLAWPPPTPDNGPETHFFPPGSTTIPPGPSLTPMTFLANTGSVGNEVIVSFEEGDPDRPLISAWFTLQDQ